jgi:nicotinate-nucleotide pyrophosphorylase
MQDALEQYPHTIVELTGSNVTAATLDWAEGEGIDILVMGKLEQAAAAKHIALGRTKLRS